MEDIAHFFQPEALHQFLAEKGKKIDLFRRKPLMMSLSIKGEEVFDAFIHF